MRSYAQERTYTSIRNDTPKLSVPTYLGLRPGEVASKSLKMEVLTQAFDKINRKPSVAESFKLGMNISNFMVIYSNKKRGFYRTTTIGSSKHLGSTLTDQELLSSLSIPREEGIASREVNRELCLGNKFRPKK